VHGDTTRETKRTWRFFGWDFWILGIFFFYFLFFLFSPRRLESFSREVREENFFLAKQRLEFFFFEPEGDRLFFNLFGFLFSALDHATFQTSKKNNSFAGFRLVLLWMHGDATRGVKKTWRFVNGCFSLFWLRGCFSLLFFSPPAIDLTPSQNTPPTKSFADFRLVLFFGAWRRNKHSKKDLAFWRMGFFARECFSPPPFHRRISITRHPKTSHKPSRLLAFDWYCF